MAAAAQADTVAGSKAALSTTPVQDTVDSAIVTNINPHTATATTLSFEIQDATGATEAFSVPKSIYTPTVGDIIDITGFSEAFHGLYELAGTTASPYVVHVDSTGNTPPALTNFTTAEFQPSFDDSLESFQGTMSNVTFVSPPALYASNQTLTVTDGTLVATVFIPSSDPLIGSAIPTGPVNITGYFGEFDDVSVLTNEPPDDTGHELDAIAVSPLPEPASASLLALGTVALLGRRRRNLAQS